MAAEAWGYEPVRFVSCTCGWSMKFKHLKDVDAVVSEHFAEGTEGCDHAIHIETLTLPNIPGEERR